MLTKLHNLTLIFFIVIGAALSVTGYFGLSDDEKKLQYAVDSIHWPCTEAIIEKRDWKVTKNKGDNSVSVRKIDFKYNYLVADKKYSSSRFLFGVDSFPNSSQKWFAEEWLVKYKPGTKHKVFYDPKEPSVSVLFPGVVGDFEQKGASSFFLGLYMICFSVVSMAVAKRLEIRNGLYLRLITGLSLVLCAPVLFYGQHWQQEFLHDKTKPEASLVIGKNGYGLGLEVKESEMIPY